MRAGGLRGLFRASRILAGQLCLMPLPSDGCRRENEAQDGRLHLRQARQPAQESGHTREAGRDSLHRSLGNGGGDSRRGRGSGVLQGGGGSSGGGGLKAAALEETRKGVEGAPTRLRAASSLTPGGAHGAQRQVFVIAQQQGRALLLAQGKQRLVQQRHERAQGGCSSGVLMVVPSSAAACSRRRRRSSPRSHVLLRARSYGAARPAANRLGQTAKLCAPAR